MKIIIASDLAPTKDNEQVFIDGNIKDKLDSEFINAWYNSDYRILNLEIVLGDKNKINPILKAGPNLIADKMCINGIKNLNPSLITLANNHIYDFGIEGLLSTTKLLSNNNIPYTGIVDSSLQEYKPYIFEKDGLKVGIYNICENEFSSATLHGMGTNSLVESKCFYEIMNIKKKIDRLIVIYHGGKEFYQFVSPNLKRLCHAFIDFGADCVIVQHTHCIGCKEKYNDKSILYGQGNFIFNNDEFVTNNKLIDTSLLVEIEVTEKKININYIPLERKNKLIEVSHDKKIIESLEERSENISNDDFVLNEYDNFVQKNMITYLKIFDRQNFIHRLIYKFFTKKIYKKLYTREFCLAILNSIECEAHRELVIHGFKKMIGDGEDEEKK